MKFKTSTLAVATVVVGLSSLAAPAHAQGNKNQVGGAAGLVAAVVQIATDEVVQINVVDSLNNLVALENVLNNSPILNDLDIIVNVGDISLLNDVDANVLSLALERNNITIDDVVGVALLRSGDIILFR